MIKCGEITQICHVLKLSIKTPRAQQICPTHSPFLQFPKYFCCQLVTSGFNSGFKQMHFNRKLSQPLRRWKTTWHFTSVKSWRCGKKNTSTNANTKSGDISLKSQSCRRRTRQLSLQQWILRSAQALLLFQNHFHSSCHPQWCHPHAMGFTPIFTFQSRSRPSTD